jgi:hypothetical protein
VTVLPCFAELGAIVMVGDTVNVRVAFQPEMDQEILWLPIGVDGTLKDPDARPELSVLVDPTYSESQ